MTFYEEQNPKDIEISQILPIITKFLPNVVESDIKFLYHGTYNVFEIKEEFIFRIPDKSLRNEKGIQLLEKERKVLHLLNSSLPIPIPNPIFINLEQNMPVMGYKRIPGISLSRCVQEIDESCLLKLARSIGKFLSHLHSVEIMENYAEYFNEEYGNFLTNFYKVWEKEYQEVKSIILPQVNDDQKNWIQSLYSCFLSEIESFNFKPTVVHGDFDTSNILVDPISCNLSGVIDFEDTRIFDPAVDFLFFREGRLFQKEIMTAYQKKIDSNFNVRMQFSFSRTFAPYILYGVKNDIPSLVKAGHELLSEKMSMFP
ncbi:MAG: phosphotransferase family protein [Candidatus Hodarchaeales archaeon]|jgi:aminoglycoside phosphotransferase (APT) family kinase protein